MLDCQKHLFNLPDDVSYLNCAYMGPLLNNAATIAQQELLKRTQPFQYGKSDFFEPVEQLKKNFAELINCHEYQRIALIPAASYGLSTAAQNVDCSTKKTIVVVEEQFPSNIYPWQRLVDQKGAKVNIIKAPEDTTEWNEKILAAINEDTAAVAMPHVHWTDGTLFDLKAIRLKSEAYGALLIIDGTQSVGALPFDLEEIRPDALICASYKWMFGPYGLGLAYFGETFDQGIPIEENWINRKDSDRFDQLVNYQPEYQAMAGRYSVGEQSNFIYVPMLNASIEQILSWGVENIQNYCKEIVSPVLPHFKTISCQTPSEGNMAFHLFGIRLPGAMDPIELKRQLDKEKVFISIRGTAIRVAPNVYNEVKDMEKLFYCMKKQLSTVSG